VRRWGFGGFGGRGGGGPGDGAVGVECGEGGCSVVVEPDGGCGGVLGAAQVPASLVGDAGVLVVVGVAGAAEVQDVLALPTPAHSPADPVRHIRRPRRAALLTEPIRASGHQLAG